MDEITKELLDALKTIESWSSHTGSSIDIVAYRVVKS